jgi:hypothetical protein
MKDFAWGGTADMNKQKGRIYSLVILASWLLACQVLAAPMPTATPEPTSTPQPVPTATPTVTPTPWPSGRMDTGMNGTLSIQGVVKDDLGNVVPHVLVNLFVYGAKAGFDIGDLGNSALYTDDTGSYAFDGVLRLQSGHYEVWFNGGPEYGKAYENSGYQIRSGQVNHNLYRLDVVVHAVTRSALLAQIEYEEQDGSTRDFYAPPLVQAEPGHVAELWRGKPQKPEYAIGAEYGRIADGTVKWEGLAGGTYFLSFTYRRQDGVIAQCHSPAIDILPGETMTLDYTIRNCSASQQPILP